MRPICSYQSNRHGTCIALAALQAAGAIADTSKAHIPWTLSTIGIIKSKCIIVKFCNLSVEDYLLVLCLPRSEVQSVFMMLVTFGDKDLTTAC